MIVVLIVIIGVLLVAALILSMSRRRDTIRAIGTLSRETRRVDRGAVTLQARTAGVLSGRQVERQAAQERGMRSSRSGAVVATSSVPAPIPRPAAVDLEALGVTRRQFLNRAILGVLGLSLAGFGTAVIGFLWPVIEAGGFGSVINVGKVSDILTSITNAETPFYSADATPTCTNTPPSTSPRPRLRAPTRIRS